MENQHKLVKGYRDLSQAEIDLMNEVKGLEQQAGQLWQRVRDADVGGVIYLEWSRSQLQSGFMWMVKAIGHSADPFSEKVEVEEDWADLEKTRDSLMARILANKEMPVLGRGTIERLESQLAWVKKKLAERQPAETFYDRLVAERDELAARTAKLESFVNAGQFKGMEQEDIDDLVSQLAEMRALLSRLEKRVERLKPEDRQP